MGLFDTPAVKELRKQAQLIGSTFGQVYLGHLSAADRDDVVGNDHMREQMRAAYAAAVADVGEKKARKAAISAANIGAESYGRLRPGNYWPMVSAAERAVGEMLGQPVMPAPGRMPSERSQSDEELTSRRYVAAAPPGPRTEQLAVTCALRAKAWPSASADRAHTVITRAELRAGAEQVRAVMVQDRDLSAQIARKILLMLNHVLEGGGTNQDMTQNKSGDTVLVALTQVGLRAAGTDAAGEVTLELAYPDIPADEDAAATMRVGRQALAVLFSVLGRGTPRQRQFYVQLHTGREGADVEAAAYKIVAWTAILTARLVHSGIHPGFIAEHTRLVPLGPRGWYPNPFNTGPIVDGDATVQRFWDEQWTDRVRVRKSGRWEEQTHSLHDPPPD